jgi:hypothetical protein
MIPVQPQGFPKTGSLRERLHEEFEAGKRAARDPLNAGLPDLAVRTTTIYSQWYTRTCLECRDKFRDDDRVRQCPRCGQAYHDDDRYALSCWRRHFAHGGVCREPSYDRIAEVERGGCSFKLQAGAENRTPAEAETDSASNWRIASISRQFLSGLQHILEKPFGEGELIEVSDRSPLIGRKCPWCRFSVRAGDRVVQCPCGCNTWFHNDVFRHLTCWNDWNGHRGRTYCPTTGRSIGTERDAPGDPYAERR